MYSRTRNYFASFFVASAMAFGGVATVDAQTQQDGLINVSIGDVTVLENVDIGVAAQLAAQVCGVKVGPVAVLGRAVDRSGAARTVCESSQGDVVLEQN
jgi:hypothetical protein